MAPSKGFRETKLPVIAVTCALVITVAAAILGNSLAAAGFAAVLFFSLFMLAGGLFESRLIQVLAAWLVAGVIAFPSLDRLSAPVPTAQPFLVLSAIVLSALVELWAFKKRSKVFESGPIHALTVAMQSLVALLGVGLSAAGFPVADALAGLAASLLLASRALMLLVNKGNGSDYASKLAGKANARPDSVLEGERQEIKASKTPK